MYKTSQIVAFSWKPNPSFLVKTHFQARFKKKKKYNIMQAYMNYEEITEHTFSFSRNLKPHLQEPYQPAHWKNHPVSSD